MALQMSFPKQLQLEEYFKCPIWWADEPKFVNKLNKASDKYIKESQKNLKKTIDERNKKFGDKGDMGYVFHSTSLIGDPNFKELQDANQSIIEKKNIKAVLDSMKKANNKLSAKVIMTTLGKDGIIINQGDKNYHIKGIPIQAIDVSGAGDTIISISCLCIVQNIPIKHIAEIANLAGAQVCEKIGVVTVDKKALLKKVKLISS